MSSARHNFLREQHLTRSLLAILTETAFSTWQSRMLTVRTGTLFQFSRGKSDGTFAPKVDYHALIAVDFNGDGKLDVAVAEPNSNTISILFGNGDGTLQSHIDLPVGQGPRSLVAGDFNNDGKVDIAVANQTDNTVSILLGNGGGSFTSHVDYPAGLAPVSIATADFNAADTSIWRLLVRVMQPHYKATAMVRFRPLFSNLFLYRAASLHLT